MIDPRKLRVGDMLLYTNTIKTEVKKIYREKIVFCFYKNNNKTLNEWYFDCGGWNSLTYFRERDDGIVCKNKK